MKTSVKGLHMIALKEGIVPAPYLDAVKVWTFGIGHTAMSGQPDPKYMDRGNPSPEDLDETIDYSIDLFKEQIKKYEDAVNKQVTVPLKQHEFDALVSFHFNTGGIYSASGVRRLNSGDKVGAWDKSFSSWNKGTINGRKVVLKGLVTRRKREKNLFFKGVYDLDPIPVIPVTSNNRPSYSSSKESVSFEEFKEYFEDDRPEPKKSDMLSKILDLLSRILKK